MDETKLDVNLALKACESLLRLHGLVDWKVLIRDIRGDRRGMGITNMDHFTGFCAHDTKMIVLDESLLKPFECGNVMLHEIAHALLPEDDKPDHSHRWAALALEIGVSEQNVRAHCPTYFERGTK